MKISYIRERAYATNSSSMHTPVIVTSGTPQDYLVDEGYFCWDGFVAASEQAKRAYVATALYGVLREIGSTDDDAIRTVESLTGVRVASDCEPENNVALIPLTFDGKHIHGRFLDDVLEWASNPQLVIGDLNGSPANNGDWCYIRDNSNYGSLAYRVFHGGCEFWSPHLGTAKARCRFDPHGFYTLFFSNGTKVRMAFDEAADTSRSSTPELVDLKITDFCTRGCVFCYQDSSPVGKHADYQHLCRIVDVLRELEVFEIALGGGEPTTHPMFKELLTYIRERGIVPNFSTGDLRWVGERPDIVQAVAASCGGFAYSPGYDTSDKTLKYYAEQLEKAGLSQLGTLQIIVFPYPTVQQELERILQTAGSLGIPGTLLGHKNTGRSREIASAPYCHRPELDWKRLSQSGARISIDTVLSAQYAKELSEAGVAKWSIEDTEGAHSMYIDAVARRVAPSSFCGAQESVSYEVLTAENVRGTFGTFAKNRGSHCDERQG